ncbi:class II glutamine amidotransferase [Actinomadura harenae]
MCGLFGLLRAPDAVHPERASDVVVTLGTLAEERGTDSAGLALLTGRPAGRDAAALSGVADDRGSDLVHDGCRVIKGRGTFSAVWRPALLDALDAAPAVLGHTRWATQGTPHSLANASPLVIGGADAVGPHAARAAGIVATHNGDIEAAAFRARFAPPDAAGGTDSEPVFQVLAGQASVPDVLAVLTALVGRAALAWVDRARPEIVHLARAACSPLSVAVDDEQNLYWASNPKWFRLAERHTSVRFATIVMLREGTYLRLGPPSPGARPEVLSGAGFLPTARAYDVDDRVWTGFTPSDATRDRDGLRHRVAPLLPSAPGGHTPTTPVTVV